MREPKQRSPAVVPSRSPGIFRSQVKRTQRKTQTTTLTLIYRKQKGRGRESYQGTTLSPTTPPTVTSTPCGRVIRIVGEGDSRRYACQTHRPTDFGQRAPPQIRSAATRSPSWRTHSPARGPAAAPPPFSGSHGRHIIWISLVQVSEKRGREKIKLEGAGSRPRAGCRCFRPETY
jgi:hypothetical protein